MREIAAFVVANDFNLDELLAFVVFGKLGQLSCFPPSTSVSLTELRQLDVETKWELLAKCVELEQLERARQAPKRLEGTDELRGLQ